MKLRFQDTRSRVPWANDINIEEKKVGADEGKTDRRRAANNCESRGAGKEIGKKGDAKSRSKYTADERSRWIRTPFPSIYFRACPTPSRAFAARLRAVSPSLVWPASRAVSTGRLFLGISLNRRACLACSPIPRLYAFRFAIHETSFNRFCFPSEYHSAPFASKDGNQHLRTVASGFDDRRGRILPSSRRNIIPQTREESLPKKSTLDGGLPRGDDNDCTPANELTPFN